MKYTIILFATFSIMGILTGTLNAKDITNRDDLLKYVAGKKLIDTANTKNWAKIETNGRLRGSFNGRVLFGKWQWRGKYWCRSGSVNQYRLKSDCQVLKVNGNTLTLIRKKGKGQKVIYKMQ